MEDVNTLVNTFENFKGMLYNISQKVAKLREGIIEKFVSKFEPREGTIQGHVYLPKEFAGKEVVVILKDVFSKHELLPQGTLERFKLLFKRHRSLCKLIEREHSTKMFSIVTETWNPVTGCLHHCKYCWARRLAETRLKNSRRYCNGFTPRLNKEEFNKKFRGGVVFVSDMGDLFGEFIPDEWIEAVIKHVKKFPNTFFLFLTKNPSRYNDFDFPENAILGATIETDKDEIYGEISKSPKPSERIKAMVKLDWDFKFLSIEPILDFSPKYWRKIEKINPFMIYIGYDNYHNKLPEPTLDKTLSLTKKLRDNGFLVLEKTMRRAWYEKEG